MDVRVLGRAVRGLPAADGTRTVEGVPVRETLALDEPLSRRLLDDCDGLW